MPPDTRTRREFLRAAGFVSASALLAGRGGRVAAQAAAGTPAAVAGWDAVPAILDRIRPPAFPDRDFEVTAFGAVADGAADCTAAIRKAVAACHDAGGGRVVVPAGVFVTGAIHLQSGVNLHVAKGATLRFSHDPAAYLPVVLTRWEGVELMNYSPFIYAFEKRDIAITGEGTLDGQADGDHWMNWRNPIGVTTPARFARQAEGRKRLMDMGARGVPVADRVFGDGWFLRPNFVQPYRCTNVLIEGVTIVRSPMWEVHPVLCTNVTVRGVTVDSHGTNNDGCDPESCRDVLIERCSFDTGDDCIAIKSGRNEDGRRVNVPSENIVVRDCVMKDGHGGVTIGSEVSGGARNVFVERCRMDSPHLERALRIKTNSVRGGFVDHVYMRDVTVGEVAEAILAVDLFYEEGDTGRFPPPVGHIEVRGVTSRRSGYALLLRGYAHTPIDDVRVSDCRFDRVGHPDVVEYVKNLVLSNVTVNGRRADRPAAR